MSDVGIYTKVADIVARAGNNANTTAKAVAATDVYVLNVESMINAETLFNWSDAYATLNADVKGILTEAGACMCAINVIMWDMSGFTTRSEAEDMINVLWARYWTAIKILKDIKKRDFINGA